MRFTPFFVGHRFKWPLKIALYVSFIKRVIDSTFGVVFLLVKLVAQRKIKARFADMCIVEWYADYSAITNGLSNIGIAIYAHHVLPK